MNEIESEFRPVPALMPVRMVNQFVWCPRFVHLAWGEGATGDNDATVEGTYLHRRVDEPSALDLPDGRTVRTAVTMSSETLGLVGRADRIEYRDDEAIVVEFKRGRAKDDENPLWEPELFQVAALALLIREQGYTCDKVEVFFGGSKRRSTVELTDAITQRVPEVIAAARQMLESPVPPPPLADSPKCPHCILAGVCLPDELSFIRQSSTAQPRNLVPTDSAARPVYVTDPGATVGKTGDRLVVKVKGEKVGDIRMIDVSSLVLMGNATVSASVIRELLSRNAPLMHLSSGGWLNGITTSVSGGNVELRKKQYGLDETSQLAIAGRMIEGKILNQRTLLRRNSVQVDRDAQRELKRLARRATQAEEFASLLGIEGGAARIYFSQFSNMLKRAPEEFDFAKRSRRPPVDPVNAVLSYCYALLNKDVLSALVQVGLDPYFGVFHRPRFGRPALALDLAEEFRAVLADSVTITAINNGVLSRRDFHVTPDGVTLTPNGRKSLIGSWERRMDTEIMHPVFGYKASYRRIIEVQARLLAAVLIGEFDLYVPMTVR